MTWAGRSRSRSLALPVSARTRRTSSIGNVLAITPRLTWSLRRTPAGRPAGTRAIAVAHPRASASMAQPHLYVNGIATSPNTVDLTRAMAAASACQEAGGGGSDGANPGASAERHAAQRSRHAGREDDDPRRL